MTDGELLCNFKNCRKVLNGVAYITRCSHAFCEEDGIKEIEAQNFGKKCPACQSPLVKNYDLVKVTLSPSDQFKSMVLAGLRPELVMDIATRAIMFWNYQLHQEHLHQQLISKHLRDLINQVKSDTEVEKNLLKSEVQTLKRKQEELEKELEKQNIKCGELSEKIAEQTREIQKWQMMYESLRRKQLSAVVLQQEPSNSYEKDPIAQNIGPQTMDEMFMNHPKNQQTTRKSSDTIKMSPYHGDSFVFQPLALNNYVSPKAFVENSVNYDKYAARRNYDM